MIYVLHVLWPKVVQCFWQISDGLRIACVGSKTRQMLWEKSDNRLQNISVIMVCMSCLIIVCVKSGKSHTGLVLSCHVLWLQLQSYTCTVIPCIQCFTLCLLTLSNLSSPWCSTGEGVRSSTVVSKWQDCL